MRKTILTLAAATLALTGVAGIALADGGWKQHRVLPTAAPQPVLDVLKAGEGTLVGTVGTVAGTWFVLDDGRNSIDVTSEHILPETIRTGETITVIGEVEDGAFEAEQIILADGTTYGRDRFERKGRHGHDD